ncbi:hypothetical protein [Tsukamurella pseudospumae]|uniref:PknH-like extracellular domain-containing protein n=1 Tax=Tsukamurella pseudospumae TaxID=239498 RepID=A0A137ZY12_9ACTN|nr:hypothetical protein [Tsukamurella pseudospumae]KXO98252.1 hypothetical protein AXK61_19700 [Tsukamurella pseudospumae]KXP03064.1 hypothetical protein AXK60_14395 [Tsukamurella pseudospumae]
MRYGRALALVALLAVAACDPGSDGDGSAASSGAAAPSSARSYPGLFAEYQGRFHPNHAGLGARSNAELAALLPGAGDFPGGAAPSTNIADEDGSGLGLHGQTDGQTRPAQCLYTPFGKSFSRNPDGSDWNLYYAASTTSQGDAGWVSVTIEREREGADVFALTTSWIAGCGTYERAFPDFAAPSTRNRGVTDTFGPGAAVSGLPSYVYTSTSVDLDDESASKPALSKLAKERRILLARVRSVVVVVEADGVADPALLDRLLVTTLERARRAA